MRSLQSKFLALTVGCVLLSALALGYVGFLYTHKLVNEDSAQFMNLFCEDKAEEINATLTSIEQSVNMIQDYTIEQYGELGKNGMDKDNTRCAGEESAGGCLTYCEKYRRITRSLYESESGTCRPPDRIFLVQG